MKAKQFIATELGVRPAQISVRKGRGTAARWLTVTTPTPISSTLKSAIEEKLVKKDLVGTYLTDYGFNDSHNVCVLWQVKTHND